MGRKRKFEGTVSQLAQRTGRPLGDARATGGDFARTAASETTTASSAAGFPPITTHKSPVAAFLNDTLPIRNRPNSVPVYKYVHSNRHSLGAFFALFFIAVLATFGGLRQAQPPPAAPAKSPALSNAAAADGPQASASISSKLVIVPDL